MAINKLVIDQTEATDEDRDLSVLNSTSPSTLPDQPGEGQEGFAKITPSIQSLQQSLQEDITGAQAALKRSQEERGMLDTSQLGKFKEKGIRVGKRVIAQEQFNRAASAQTKAINTLITQSGLVDQSEQIEMSNRINNRLNELKMKLLKKGIEFEKRLGEYKSTEQQKVMARKLFGSLVGKVTGGILGGYFGGPGGAAAGSQAGGQLGSSIN